MAIRDILLYPESEVALRKKSESVGTVDRQVKLLIRDLKDTLAHNSKGIGLAAPQINVHKRVVIIQLGAQYDSHNQNGKSSALVNPVILETDHEQRDYDGCLSFPGLYGETMRPHRIRVSGLDERGEPFEQVFEGFDAVLVHHEIDHLNGVLFIDRIERLDDLYRLEKDEYGRMIRVSISADLAPEGMRNYQSIGLRMANKESGC
jgi:peptide deformylase